MKDAGAIAVVLGVGVVVYNMLPLLWSNYRGGAADERWLITVGVVLIAGGIFYFLRQRRPP